MFATIEHYNYTDKLSKKQSHTSDDYKPEIVKVDKCIKRDADPSGMKEDKIYNTYKVYFNKPKAIYNQPHHYTVTARNLYINLVEMKNTDESPVEMELKGFKYVNKVDFEVTIYYKDIKYTSDKYSIEL